MVSLGVGEIMGAFGMGYFVDKIGPKKGSFINVALIIIQTVLVILYIHLDKYSWLAFVMTFAWGLQDSAMSIHLDAILASEFDSNKEPFSLDVLLESITAFSFEIIQSFMGTNEKRIIYMAAVGILGAISNMMTYYFEYRNPGGHGSHLTHEQFIEKTLVAKLETISDSDSRTTSFRTSGSMSSYNSYLGNRKEVIQ